MRFACIALLPLAPALAFSQGIYVNFNNAVLTPPPDRFVRFYDGTPMVGTNFAAQLLIGVDAGSLQPTAVAPSRFRNSDTALPGTWQGRNIDLTGILPGTVLTMQVRVWNTDFGTFEQAAQFSQAGALQPFQWTAPASGSRPEDYLMHGFVGGFPFPIPEPTVLALAILALPFTFLWRKYRR